MIVSSLTKPTLSEILSDAESNTLNITVNIGTPPVSTTVCTHDDILNRLKYTYGTFRCCHCDTWLEFKAYFNHFVSLNSHEIGRMYTALRAEYNPIENYNKSDITIASASATHSYDRADDSALQETGKIVSDSTQLTNTVHGNIGVMTNQSMINDEISMRISLNLTKIVVDMFSDSELF